MQQSEETCQAIEELITGRNVERAGENCSLNTECTQFQCVGVVDEINNFVATTTYTFHPCNDPVSLSVLATVTSLDDPVLDAEVSRNMTVDFVPSGLGGIHLTLEQQETGVRFGVSS